MVARSGRSVRIGAGRGRRGRRGVGMTGPKPERRSPAATIAGEWAVVAGGLLGLAGTLALVLGMYRDPRRDRPEETAPVVAMETPAPERPADPVVASPPAAEPSPAEVQDPTPGALAALSSAEEAERRAA